MCTQILKLQHLIKTTVCWNYTKLLKINSVKVEYAENIYDFTEKIVDNFEKYLL